MNVNRAILIDLKWDKLKESCRPSTTDGRVLSTCGGGGNRPLSVAGVKMYERRIMIRKNEVVL